MRRLNAQWIANGCRNDYFPYSIEGIPIYGICDLPIGPSDPVTGYPPEIEEESPVPPTPEEYRDPAEVGSPVPPTPEEYKQLFDSPAPKVETTPVPQSSLN